MFLLKLRRDIPYTMLSLIFGNKEDKLCRLFNEVLMYVYSKQFGPTGDPTWLHRGRNLAQIHNLLAFYEEVHHYTMLQERLGCVVVFGSSS